MVTSKLVKYLPFFFVFLCPIWSVGQSNWNENKVTEGSVRENLKNGDSIFFSHGMFSEKYYQTNVLGSDIKNNRFSFKNTLTYPHMLFVNFKSERDEIIQRAGVYFVDEETEHITVDSIGECSTVNGPTHREFEDKFIPFLFRDTTYDCRELQFSNLYYLDRKQMDYKLTSYIEENPDTYVGLWFLQDR